MLPNFSRTKEGFDISWTWRLLMRDTKCMTCSLGVMASRPEYVTYYNVGHLTLQMQNICQFGGVLWKYQNDTLLRFIQYNTGTIQYNTIQYNTIQYNTIQYKISTRRNKGPPWGLFCAKKVSKIFLSQIKMHPTSLLGTHIGVPSLTIPASTATPRTMGSRVLKICSVRTRSLHGNIAICLNSSRRFCFNSYQN
jgi:hypothetical protein